MAEEKPAGGKKVFDITKPGKAAPDASARPLIVGHKPLVKDTVVVDKEEKAMASAPLVAKEPEEKPSGEPAVSEAPDTAPVAVKRKVIAPITTPAPTKDPVATAPTKSDSAAEHSPTSSSEASEPPKSKISTATAASTRAAENKQALEQTARLVAAEKLIESKQYFLPIGEGKHKGSGHHALEMMVLLLLVLLLGAYLAVDAGYLDVGITPPIDLIKN